MLGTRSVRTSMVAAVAILLVGCGGNDAPADDEGAPGDNVVAVTGTDSLRWEPESLSAEPGVIEITLSCEDGVNHDLQIQETGDDVVSCAPGETASGTVELEAGQYTFVCTVPGHESTMQGTLTVG